jgi:hypothetical protein
MNMAEAIQVGTEWVESYAPRDPDFRGAHLLGSTNWLPRDAAFPSTSDVDISILVDRPSQPHEAPGEEYCRGVAIEYGPRSVDLYRSPEVVLANPDLASNLAVDSILSDPYGLLAAIQPGVAAGYGQRRWVSARCEQEKQEVLAAVGRAAQGTMPSEFVREAVITLIYLAGLITEAALRPPTHRKCLVLLRELLQAEGRDELYEETLAIAGFAQVTADQVIQFQKHVAAAFDRAATIKRTPFPDDFKLQPHLRAYLIGGNDLMIREGNHREALPWIGFLLYLCAMALNNDGLPGEGARFLRIRSGFFELLGVDSAAARADKLQRAIKVKDSIFALADEMVARVGNDTPTIVAST